MNQTQQAGGLNWRYVRTGRGAGHTILFVHGFPLDHTMWAGQLNGLGDDADLIAVDLPGYGGSQQPETQTSMARFADLIATFLDSINVDQAIVCGLSMGGYIGLEFADRHADRVGGLILSNTRATADDEVTARGRHVAAAQVMTDGAGPVADAMQVKLFAESTSTDRPELIEQTVATIRATHPQTIAWGQLAMANRAEYSNQISKFEMPVLVVAGQHDVITPADDMRRMAKQIAGAKFVEIASAGHLAPTEQPEAFNAAVRKWISER